MSKELVRLPRGVAEELTAIQQHESYPIRFVIDIFHGVVDGNNGDLQVYFESDRSRRIEIIMKALVNGYEIEETPEDKVREYYQHQKAAVVNGNDFDKPTTAIRYVLECLNIKIDGVW